MCDGGVGAAQFSILVSCSLSQLHTCCLEQIKLDVLFLMHT